MMPSLFQLGSHSTSLSQFMFMTLITFIRTLYLLKAIKLPLITTRVLTLQAIIGSTFTELNNFPPSKFKVPHELNITLFNQH